MVDVCASSVSICGCVMASVNPDQIFSHGYRKSSPFGKGGARGIFRSALKFSLALLGQGREPLFGSRRSCRAWRCRRLRIVLRPQFLIAIALQVVLPYTQADPMLVPAAVALLGVRVG